MTKTLILFGLLLVLASELKSVGLVPLQDQIPFGDAKLKLKEEQPLDSLKRKQLHDEKPVKGDYFREGALPDFTKYQPIHVQNTRSYCLFVKLMSCTPSIATHTLEQP